MRALLTLPLFAALAAAVSQNAHPSYRSSGYEHVNRYQGPVNKGAPIVWAKKSFFESDLSVQPSVLYRLVTLPSFAVPSSFGSNGLESPQSLYGNDYNSGARYEDNAIDVDRPPALYFKGDSGVYAKKSFGNFGLRAEAGGPKPISGYRRDFHSIQGGFYRPWDAQDNVNGYESAPRPITASPYYGGYPFNRNHETARRPL